MDDFLGKSYFELFDLPAVYAINLNQLRERFRDVQKAVHPDRFSADSAQTQRLAVQYAAHANQAFQTLKDPVARGFYLLTLRGFQIDAASATIKDTAFLMQQMLLRERLDMAATPDEFAQLLEEVEADQASLIGEISEQFATDASLESIAACLKKVQFYKRLIEEIEERS